ncbi:MAG TPA: protein-disulfide reductase DsbD domain-containing protein [Verrucomicrobiae bacterium]|nr:protein-disulfide reductase DsbD domain-containing protein [Verrucomicrobiae bacterium]
MKPAVYLSLEPVPRGWTFEIAVVGQIQQGFHVNANKVLEDYLIPTTVTAQLPAGWKVLDTKYPDGKELKFEFSEKPLNVYEGTFTARMKLTAPADAPLGAIKLPLTLRYQACNDTVCLPPVKLALEADVMVAAANAKAVPVNQKIFSGK